MPRFVFVVDRDQGEIYRSLAEEFAGDADVQVVLDRRHGERRRSAPAPATADRRRRERRGQATVRVERRSPDFALARAD